MHKKVLSEIDLHYGTIDMPKGFEIDQNKLQSDILLSQITKFLKVYETIREINPTR